MHFSCFAGGIDPSRFGYHAMGGHLHWGYYCGKPCMSMGFHPMVFFQDMGEVVDFMDGQAQQSLAFKEYIEKVKEAHGKPDEPIEDWTKDINLEGL